QAGTQRTAGVINTSISICLQHLHQQRAQDLERGQPRGQAVGGHEGPLPRSLCCGPTPQRTPNAAQPVTKRAPKAKEPKAEKKAVPRPKAKPKKKVKVEAEDDEEEEDEEEEKENELDTSDD
ncbi:hypothetical protein B0H14DRAFT_3150188, partial [Mycena olivaceomarginata]